VFASTASNAVGYGMTFLAIAGLYPQIPILFSWASNSFGNSSRRAVGIALPSALGQCFSFVGTLALYPSSDGPRYVKGNTVCCVLAFIGALSALTLHVLLSRENKRRDRVENHADCDKSKTIEHHGDKAFGYRYWA